MNIQTYGEHTTYPVGFANQQQRTMNAEKVSDFTSAYFSARNSLILTPCPLLPYRAGWLPLCRTALKAIAYSSDAYTTLMVIKQR
jgi:hypothetical protein